VIKKITILALIASCIFAFAYGINKRDNFPDLTSENDYLDKVLVAEISDKLAVSKCELMAEELKNEPLILRVKISGDIEHLHGNDRQKCIVEEVYKGDSIKEGDSIYLFSGSWSMVLYDPDYKSISRGFVNIPETGKEYLAFSDGRILTDKEDVLVSVDDQYIIAPFFSYDEHDNVIIETSGDTTYVNYRDVKDNEFFAADKEALEAMISLKEKMISLYPQD